MLELVNYDNQDIEQELVCDTATPGLMSCDDKKKLDGIAEGANKYVHPGYTARTSGLYKITVDDAGHVSSVTAVTKADITALGIPGQDTNTVYTHPGTHPASMITQDSTHRFVSDTEKNTWNGKADGSHAHSWSSITGKPGSFTPSSHTHPKSQISDLHINTAAECTTYTADDNPLTPAAVKKAFTIFDPKAHSHNYLPMNPASIEMYAIAPFIDFHYGSSSADYTTRLTAEGNDIMRFKTPDNKMRLFIGEKLELRTDNEGGNITLTSPSGAAVWEMDSFNNNELRIINLKNSAKGIHIDKYGGLTTDEAITCGTRLMATNPSGGDAFITLDRGPNANWKMVNSGGSLYFQCDWDGGKSAYWNAGKFDYSSGNLVLEYGLYIGATGDLYSSTWLSRLSNNAAGLIMMGSDSWAAVGAFIDNACSIGYSSNRFTRLYAVSATISTSDEYEKDIIPEGITEEYEELFMKLEPILYKWKNEDRVIKKRDENGEEKEITINSNHDRIHCGLGARTTEKHAEEVGLDSISFAAICKDKLEEPTEDGRTERYGIAYEELHGLEIHMIQKNRNELNELKEENAQLKTRLKASEDKNAELEERLKKLEALLLK